MGKSGRRDRSIIVRVNADEERELRLTARAERITMSELIRRAVRERAEQLTERPGR